MEVLTTLVEGDFIEIVTGDEIEMRKGKIYINEVGRFGVKGAFKKITTGHQADDAGW